MPLETPDAEVPAEAAYLAAQDRALKTTAALILSDARVLDLTRQVQRLERDCLSYRAELLRLGHDQEEEVKHDATADEERPNACCAARTPHDFSD